MTEQHRNVLILADLHFDAWIRAGRDPLALIPAETWARLDGLIIAGDLSNNPLGGWPAYLKRVGEQMPLERVHVFPGNHDYYGHALDDEAIIGRAAERVGATFAQKAQIVVGRTRFLCCTLWTDFELNGDAEASKAAAYRGMNDYQAVFASMDDLRVLRPNDTLTVHCDHRAWLQAALDTAFDGDTIVVTHHAPVPQGLMQPIDALGPAFGSDLRDLIAAHQPRAWFYGHTHIPYRGRFGRTDVINCSLGYPGEVSESDGEALANNGLIHIDEDGLPVIPALEPSGQGGSE